MGTGLSKDSAHFSPTPLTTAVSLAARAVPYGGLAVNIINLVLQTKKYGETRLVVADLIERGERAAIAYQFNRELLQKRYGDILTGRLALPPATEADEWYTFLEKRAESIIKSNDAMGTYASIMQHFTLLNQAVHRLHIIESAAAWIKADPARAGDFMRSPMVDKLFRDMSAMDQAYDHIEVVIKGGSLLF